MLQTCHYTQLICDYMKKDKDEKNMSSFNQSFRHVYVLISNHFTKIKFDFRY